MSKDDQATSVTCEDEDALAAVIDQATNATLHIRFDITGDRAWFADRMPRDLADAILAAGWRPPARTASTVEELDALPRGVVVRSSAGTIACRYDAEVGVVFGDERPYRWGDLGLPVTVLHEGGA